MVDTSLAAFRLLELIALLFPVVALLVQLQHRATDSGIGRSEEASVDTEMDESEE